MYAGDFRGYLPRGNTFLAGHNTYIATGKIGVTMEQGALVAAGYITSFDIAWCPLRISYDYWDSYEWGRLKFEAFRAAPTGTSVASSTYYFRYHGNNNTPNSYLALNFNKDAAIARLPIMWDFIGGSTKFYHNHPNGYVTLYGGGHVRWIKDYGYAAAYSIAGAAAPQNMGDRDIFAWNFMDMQ